MLVMALIFQSQRIINAITWEMLYIHDLSTFGGLLQVRWGLNVGSQVARRQFWVLSRLAAGLTQMG